MSNEEGTDPDHFSFPHSSFSPEGSFTTPVNLGGDAAVGFDASQQLAGRRVPEAKVALLVRGIETRPIGAKAEHADVERDPAGFYLPLLPADSRGQGDPHEKCLGGCG